MVIPKWGSDTYAVIVFVLLWMLIVVLFAVQAPRQRRKEEPPQPPVVNCRILHLAAEELDGREVRLVTSGMQPTDDPAVFVYRRAAHENPIVTVKFTSAPGLFPSRLRGTCRRLGDGTVTLDGCRSD